MAIDPADVVHVTGSNGLVSTIAPAQQSTPRILGMINAAAGQFSGRIAPGEVISIYGYGLGTTTPAIQRLAPAPFQHNSVESKSGQLRAHSPALRVRFADQRPIPAPLSNLDNAVVRIVNGSATPPDFRASVDASIFGVFPNSEGRPKPSIRTAPSIPLRTQLKPAPFLAFGPPDSAGTVVLRRTATSRQWRTTGAAIFQIAVEGINATTANGGAASGLIDGVMQINFTVPPQPGFISNPVFLDFFGDPAATLYVSQ